MRTLIYNWFHLKENDKQLKFFSSIYSRFRLNLEDKFYVFDGEIPADTWTQVVLIYNGFHGGVRVHVNGEVKNMEENERNGRTENSGDVVIGRRYVEILGTVQLWWMS